MTPCWDDQCLRRSLVLHTVTDCSPILAGGLTRRRRYLIEGVPGAGKTALALQFLLAGSEWLNAFSTSPCPRRTRW